MKYRPRRPLTPKAHSFFIVGPIAPWTSRKASAHPSSLILLIVSSLRFLLATALLLFRGIATAAPPKATCTFDDHGLTSLSYGGVEFLKNGTLRLNTVWFS